MEKELLEKIITHALKLLARRQQSEQELRQKLTRYLSAKGRSSSGRYKVEASELYINEVVDYLKKKHFIEDESFAESFVTSRQRVKPRSRKMLRLELQKKGIAPEIIEKQLEEYDEEAALRAVINKKHYYSPEDLMRYLLSQGFPYDLIKEVTML